MAPTKLVFATDPAIVGIATTQSHITCEFILVFGSGLVHISECSPLATFRTMIYETCLVPFILVLAWVSVVAPATRLGSDAYHWQILFHFHGLVFHCFASLVHIDIVCFIDFHHVLVFDCCVVIGCVACWVDTVINAYATSQ